MGVSVKEYPTRTNSRDLNYELIEKTINKINQFVSDNNYQYKNIENLNSITIEAFTAAVRENSKRKRKRLAALIWGVNNNPTLERVNKFFHFLTAKFMKISQRIKVEKSEKELAIQGKRQTYKDALNKFKESEAYKALLQSRADYNAEKGTFYKERLAKKLAV